MTGSCPRDGREQDGELTGFLTEVQMLMHANSKHVREYGIWTTMRQVGGTAAVNVDKLRAEILAEVMEQMTAPDAEKQPVAAK